ncbi:MAG: hypothetical protein K2K34_03545, partial [Oscillospiraceae bacterium]|nr:hypothetical protein [Oscillospiraceae bacterium]
APPRNAVAFLTPFTVLNDMRLRARGRDFAALLKLTYGQLRPKAPPLDFASWAQLDQLMSAASPPKGLLHSAWCAKSKFTAERKSNFRIYIFSFFCILQK